jgi:hypothetical protein
MGSSNVELVGDTTFTQELSKGLAYVGNWEKFVSRDKKTGDYKNRIVREGDNRNFFDALIEVGNKGIPVIVCIDEAHHGKGSTVSSIRVFLNDIKEMLGYSPFYLEISATPILEGAVTSVKIPLADVQAEELVRKNVRLNGIELIDKVNELTNEQRASQEIEPFLLDHAIELQGKIDAKYVEYDAHETIADKKDYFHSLIGIQIPNSEAGNEALARIESQLREKYGITRDNDQLFVYLSDDNDKSGKKHIFNNMSNANSPVKVLVYKQGVAVGWDCPRAQILVGYRHITSKIFTKQNLGRFVRTTEQKYYGDDMLDYTYVISNVGDLGAASFGDEVDTTFVYEKESVLRVGKDGHTAMSSFNKVKLPRNHYAFVNQTRVAPAALKSAWADEAAKVELWDSLRYSNAADISDQRLIAGEMGMEGIDNGEGFKTVLAISKSLSEDNLKQYRNFEAMIFSIITDKGRNYGANAQIARTLGKIIIRWYRETVWNEFDANIKHTGKRKDVRAVIKAEQTSGIRSGTVDETDFAVEQLSLDQFHWKAVASNIARTLNAIPSTALMTDEEFRQHGSSWAERKIVEDNDFIISQTEHLWIPAVSANMVGLGGVGINSNYAYHIYGDDSASYREGGALLSGPETSFEKNAIPSMNVSSNKGKILAYYSKSPENSNKSFRIGVASLDKSKVSDFYPDYTLEIYDETTKLYSPAIIEVKSESDVLAAEGDLGSILIAKAKALVDIAQKHVIKAGVAYEKDTGLTGKEWVIITGVNDEANITIQGLKQYLLN